MRPATKITGRKQATKIYPLQSGRNLTFTKMTIARQGLNVLKDRLGSQDPRFGTSQYLTMKNAQ